MDEMFIKNIADFYEANLEKLEKLYRLTEFRTDENNKLVTPQIQAKLVENGLFTKEDIEWFNEYFSPYSTYPDGTKLPSFILDRSIVITGNNIVSLGMGEIIKQGKIYEERENGTFTQNNGVIAYKDNEGIVRVIPADEKVRKFLTDACKFRETYNLSVPIDGSAYIFADPELQKKWEDFFEIEQETENSNIDIEKYFQSKGKEMFLSNIIFETYFTMESILKDLYSKTTITQDDIKKMYDKIDNAGERIKASVQKRKQSQDNLRQLEEKQKLVNPKLQTYKIWTIDLLEKIKINKQKYDNLSNEIIRLSIDEVKDDYKFDFKPSPYVANAKMAINAVKESKIDFQEEFKLINKELATFGLSIMDLFPENNTIHIFDEERQNRVVLQNAEIERYLRARTLDYYEDDIVITNINRLIDISTRINNSGNPQEENNKILQFLFDELTYYLNTNFENYKEQLQMCGINIESHLEKIDAKLKPLGLNLSDIQAKEKSIAHTNYSNEKSVQITPKNISKKYEINKNLSLIFKKYFDTEINFNSGDYMEKLVISKIIIENFAMKEYKLAEQKVFGEISNGWDLDKDRKLIQNHPLNSFGELLDDFERNLILLIIDIDNEIVDSFNEEYKKRLEKSGQNWEEYKNRMNILLSKIGLSVDDIMATGFVRSNETFNKETLNVSKEVFVQMCEDKEKEEKLKKLGKPTEKLEIYEDNYESLLDYIGEKETKQIVSISR